MKLAIERINEILKEKGIEEQPKIENGVAKWKIKCDKDDAHFQDRLTDWVDNCLPIGFTFGVERIYGTEVTYLMIKEIDKK